MISDTRACHAGGNAVAVLCNLAVVVVQELEAAFPHLLLGEPRVYRPLKAGTYRPLLLLDTRAQGWRVLLRSEQWPGTDAGSTPKAAAAAAAIAPGGSFWGAYDTPEGQYCWDLAVRRARTTVTSFNMERREVARARQVGRRDAAAAQLSLPLSPPPPGRRTASTATSRWFPASRPSKWRCTPTAVALAMARRC